MIGFLTIIMNLTTLLLWIFCCVALLYILIAYHRIRRSQLLAIILFIL